MTAAARDRTLGLAGAALSGALFGAGLVVSGMTQPARIIGFLDVLGGWDPSLAFVMVGAVTIYTLAYALIRRRARPWFDVRFHTPSRADIDLPLVLGAAVFGIGWGLGGLCPGPGIVAAAGGSTAALGFVLAMLVGMHVHHLATGED
jgi:uncharacterized protein